jgi:DNA-binding NarL/FixJ family response regulator
VSRHRAPNPHPAKRIRVAIIEDHALVRAGIRMLIEREPGIEVVSEATTATEALAGKSARPDIILLDIRLRAELGLDVLPRLLKQFAPAKVLVLTAVEDPETQLLAIEAGASGVVMKEQSPEVLVKAIQAVSLGEPWIGSALSTAALHKLSRARSRKDRAADSERTGSYCYCPAWTEWRRHCERIKNLRGYGSSPHHIHPQQAGSHQQARTRCLCLPSRLRPIPRRIGQLNFALPTYIEL